MGAEIEHLTTCPADTWLHNYGHVYQTFGRDCIAQVRDLLPERIIDDNGWTAIRSLEGSRTNEDAISMSREMTNIVEAVCDVATSSIQKLPNRTTRLDCENISGSAGGRFNLLAGDVHATPRTPNATSGLTSKSAIHAEILDVVSLELYRPFTSYEYRIGVSSAATPSTCITDPHLSE
jgi:hypothetical protein